MAGFASTHYFYSRYFITRLRLIFFGFKDIKNWGQELFFLFSLNNAKQSIVKHIIMYFTNSMQLKLSLLLLLQVERMLNYLFHPLFQHKVEYVRLRFLNKQQIGHNKLNIYQRFLPCGLHLPVHQEEILLLHPAHKQRLQSTMLLLHIEYLFKYLVIYFTQN